MAKVVFFSFALTGHVNPTIGLIREMVNRGEEVIYYGTEDYRRKIEPTGATFRSYVNMDEEMEDHTPHEDGFSTFAIWVDSIYRQSLLFYYWGLEQALQDKPDYLMHDSMCPAVKLIADQLGIPAISSITTFAIHPRCIDEDPDFTALYLLRMQPEDYDNGGAKFVHRVLGKLIKHLLVKYNKTEEFHAFDMIACHEPLNIVYTSRLLQFCPNAFDETYQFIGPSLNIGQEIGDFPIHLLKDVKVIYFSMGTLFNKNRYIYETCFQAFSQSDYLVVLSIGNGIDAASFPHIPDNFIVRNWVPQLAILPYTDIFITHGGTNSVNEGLYFDVPLIVYPQSIDQYMSGELVERLEAGVFLRDRPVSAEDLAKAVHRIESNDSYRKNSAIIGESLRNAGGVGKAVDAIFEYTRKAIHA